MKRTNKYEELAAYMPLNHIIDALDDDDTGVADPGAWALVKAEAQNRLEAAAGSVATLGLLDTGAVAYAERLFIMEILYTRRGFDIDKNPFTKRAAEAEKNLRNLADKADAGEAEGAAVMVGKKARMAGAERLVM